MKKKFLDWYYNTSGSIGQLYLIILLYTEIIAILNRCFTPIWAVSFIIISLAYLILGLKRIDNVASFRLELLRSSMDLYDRLPEFTVMVNKFWVKDLTSFIAK